MFKRDTDELMRFLIFFSLIALTLGAVPAQIILIRHGEKPSDPLLPNLSQGGYERSGALSYFFSLDPLVLDFGFPAAMFATKPFSLTHREIETLAPTAQKFGLPIHAPFFFSETDQISELILNDQKLEGRSVLICWEHHVIPDLVLALRGPATPDYPDNRFDLVYKLTYTNPAAPTLCVGLQNLMEDDSPTLPVDFDPFACP